MFVPAPNASSEDDGVLLTPVLNGTARTTYIQILDAKTMTEIATVDLDIHTPFAIHGNWFSTPHE
jgi:carotenoid cleavage dioxygenase-like enzyme